MVYIRVSSKLYSHPLPRAHYLFCIVLNHSNQFSLLSCVKFVVGSASLSNHSLGRFTIQIKQIPHGGSRAHEYSYFSTVNIESTRNRAFVRHLLFKSSYWIFPAAFPLLSCWQQRTATWMLANATMGISFGSRSFDVLFCLSFSWI